MRYTGLMLLALALALAAGCGGEPEEPRPEGVPDRARLVRSEAELDARGDRGQERVFSAHGCAADILTVSATLETVYAELPCERSLPEDVVRRFEGTAVTVTLRVADNKLLLRSDEAGSVEFTTGRMWIEDTR